MSTVVSPRGRMALVALGTLALMGALLLVQHLRHGWPFSLHHGLPVAGGPTSSRPVSPTGNAHPRGPVTLDPGKAAALGIRTEPVRREMIARPIRAVATIVPDESRVSHVHTRVAGWIEKLHVNTTGERVRAGQPLAEIFSQELLASQTEYLAAFRAAPGGSGALLAGARSRLQVLGMSRGQIAELERRGQPRRTVTVAAPRAGVVIRRAIAVGTAVDPSTEIVTVADLSHVWAVAEIPEADIPGVKVGSAATLNFPSSGREPFDGAVTFVSPTLSERTRTLRVRFELPNPGGRLRPGLFGTAEFRSDPRQALTVARDAVVDTGLERLVFVAESPDRLVPLAVELGVRLGDRIEVRKGVQEGQPVVASGVFLVDSESRLRATGGTGHQHGSADPKTDPHQGHTPAPAADPPPARTGHEGH